MKKTYYLIAFFVVIFISLFNVYKYMPREQDFAAGADEGHYLTYAKRISENGIKIYPEIFDEHVKIKENQIWPSPLRVGYFLLAAQWFKFFGSSLRSLAKLSFICYILFLLLSLYFSKKYFGKGIASLFVLLLAFSPLPMAMAKRALSDSAGNLFAALSIWLFLDFLLEKKLLNFILFEAIYIYSILVREQSVLLICFFSLFFIIYKYAYKVNIPKIYFPAIIFVPITIVGLAWLISAQSFANVISMIKLTRALPALNQYSALFCRGPWFRYIIDYLLISPLATILALAFIIYALTNREILKDYKITYFLVLFLILYILLSSFDYNKNIRYAITLDIPMRLFTVFMLKEIFKKSKFSVDFIFISVLFFCFIDYQSFLALFCQKNIYDPVSFTLLKARQFIP